MVSFPSTGSPPRPPHTPALYRRKGARTVVPCASCVNVRAAAGAQQGTCLTRWMRGKEEANPLADAGKQMHSSLVRHPCTHPPTTLTFPTHPRHREGQATAAGGAARAL